MLACYSANCYTTTSVDIRFGTPLTTVDVIGKTSSQAQWLFYLSQQDVLEAKGFAFHNLESDTYTYFMLVHYCILHTGVLGKGQSFMLLGHAYYFFLFFSLLLFMAERKWWTVQHFGSLQPSHGTTHGIWYCLVGLLLFLAARSWPGMMRRWEPSRGSGANRASRPTQNHLRVDNHLFAMLRYH